MTTAILFTAAPHAGGFALLAAGKPLKTPAGNALIVPSKPLAEALAVEWCEQQKFNSAKMPLTALAYTAIDQIAARKEDVVEALLVYIDTDTLSYRASGSDTVAKMQAKEWDPVLDWIKESFSVTWGTTSGVMPIEQDAALHNAIKKYLLTLSDMELAAACVLASGFSSIALAVAVSKKHVDAKQGFALSRVEEEAQAEAWGRDEEASKRAAKLEAEMLAAGHFLRLLEAA